mmetsp:Transcript_23108/g.30770  ORF Transcript_23108/g.30770 Transcript_23108/m.30770 type:complete len:316 (+) Transcript_23108:186-1133(+)|eukprot:CAMPEP_0185571886 /NCGR_PEP_ID=MMETSP0434-20130131/3885_1 /TAXON_ID=626734 ORGANISM="Favella taraikaensis, Strain Fe Narragansett Bay" /NCGR_SAMPLE_ID=MMETSP0434 /ASSEMBLY_ACC=CAM_ASM_000379 /LENGTH=315 /DNA_ID=CAMNT_0028187519 /DNA_START=146 /DNA_END=1093 /DNA_ORIENTATION=-
MAVDLDQRLQFEAVGRGQVRSIALDESKECLVPHDGHLLLSTVARSCVALLFAIHLIDISCLRVHEVGEEGDKGVNDLRGQSVLLGEQSLQEEATSHLVLHVSALHDGCGRVQVVDTALGQDAPDDHRFSRRRVLSKRQQESSEEGACLEDCLFDSSVQMAIEFLEFADVAADVLEQNQRVEALHHLSIQVTSENFCRFVCCMRAPHVRLREEKEFFPVGDHGDNLEGFRQLATSICLHNHAKLLVRCNHLRVHLFNAKVGTLATLFTILIHLVAVLEVARCQLLHDHVGKTLALADLGRLVGLGPELVQNAHVT